VNAKIEKMLRAQGFDDRQIKEIKWSEKYDEKDETGQSLFAHGTTGHNQMLVIAKLLHLITWWYEKGCPDSD
jgi:hypothetical protein